MCILYGDWLSGFCNLVAYKCSSQLTDILSFWVVRYLHAHELTSWLQQAFCLFHVLHPFIWVWKYDIHSDQCCWMQQHIYYVPIVLSRFCLYKHKTSLIGSDLSSTGYAALSNVNKLHYVCQENALHDAKPRKMMSDLEDRICCICLKYKERWKRWILLVCFIKK